LAVYRCVRSAFTASEMNMVMAMIKQNECKTIVCS